MTPACTWCSITLSASRVWALRCRECSRDWWGNGTPRVASGSRAGLVEPSRWLSRRAAEWRS